MRGGHCLVIPAKAGIQTAPTLDARFRGQRWLTASRSTLGGFAKSGLQPGEVVT
jgi:hypothetical protein